MAVKLLIVVEDDVEGVYDFANKALSNAFESGFGMAAGLLGSPSYDIYRCDEDGVWRGEDLGYDNRAERMNEAIKAARKRGCEV